MTKVNEAVNSVITTRNETITMSKNLAQTLYYAASFFADADQFKNFIFDSINSLNDKESILEFLETTSEFYRLRDFLK